MSTPSRGMSAQTTLCHVFLCLLLLHDLGACLYPIIIALAFHMYMPPPTDHPHPFPSFTLSPCAVESHPIPGDSRGSSSLSLSIPGISSHFADGGSARIPLECVQPSLSWSSSLPSSIHSPSITSSSIPPAVTMCPK